MKKLMLAALLLLCFCTCKKDNSDKASSFTVTENSTVHNFIVNPSSSTDASVGLSEVVQNTLSIFQGSYIVDITLSGESSQNRIYFWIENLNESNQDFDYNDFYTEHSSVTISGITYNATALHINSVNINIDPYAWPGEPSITGKASGSVDITIQTSIGPVLIKGYFKDIFSK